MRKVDDGKRKEKNGVFSGHYVIASPNGYARTTTAGTPHARANTPLFFNFQAKVQLLLAVSVILVLVRAEPRPKAKPKAQDPAYDYGDYAYPEGDYGEYGEYGEYDSYGE